MESEASIQEVVGIPKHRNLIHSEPHVLDPIMQHQFRFADTRCLHAPTRRHRLRVAEFRSEEKLYQALEVKSVRMGATSTPRLKININDLNNSIPPEINTKPFISLAGLMMEDGSAQFVDHPDSQQVPKLDIVDPDSSASETMQEAQLRGEKQYGPELTGTYPATTTVDAKRPRGRPRIHPKSLPGSSYNVAKGRSKTGCITCRKRKKKCDEKKPTCLNCEKNSVMCEGYLRKTLWKSGKERVEEIPRSMGLSFPFLVSGIETESDRIFLHHFIYTLSSKFTPEDEINNAFRSILLPMAQKHTGLMHSILSLSSKHLNFESHYGLQIMEEYPNVSLEMLNERSIFHEKEALKELVGQQSDQKVTSATFAQILCQVLETLKDLQPEGRHRIHLQYYRRLIRGAPPQESREMRFIHEFFEYHISTDELIHLPRDESCITTADDWKYTRTILKPAAVHLLGVSDGLFLYMSKVTTIRNKIRKNISTGIDPIVDYKSFFAAAEIDAAIREWTPAWPAGDARDTAGMLYRQMIWIYLWRTIYPPQITKWKHYPQISLAVNKGINLLAQFGPQDSTQKLILAPAFVIGCAAFEQSQREHIRKVIRILKGYMEFSNSEYVLKVMEEIWRLMDAHDERSWDWQNIAHQMGIDFLVT